MKRVYGTLLFCLLTSLQILLADSIKRAKSFDIYLSEGQLLKMIWVPAGEFLMGSPASEEGRDEDEPQHSVKISHGFWLAETEMTQGQWKTLMGDNPSFNKEQGDKHPVEQVSWTQAVEFCAKLSAKDAEKLPESYKYFLPTEAQWEYACRAGTKTAFSYGNDLDSSMANFDGNYPYGNGERGIYRDKTIAVAQFKPNAWGFYDMHGNVWEWCSDWFGTYDLKNTTDPQGPGKGKKKVNRGGSWYLPGNLLRSAARLRDVPSKRYNTLGFRLALVFEDKKSD